jgi:hypothetical protein
MLKYVLDFRSPFGGEASGLSVGDGTALTAYLLSVFCAKVERSLLRSYSSFVSTFPLSTLTTLTDFYEKSRKISVA